MTTKLPVFFRLLAASALALATLSACTVPAPRSNTSAAAVKAPVGAVRTMADFDAVYIAALATSTPRPPKAAGRLPPAEPWTH